MDKTLRDMASSWRQRAYTTTIPETRIAFNIVAEELETWAMAKAKEWRNRDEPLTLQESADELWPEEKP